MPELSCQEFAELAPELALGIAEARERAAALAHLERCAACRHHLQDLREVAESLVELAPAVDPPAGFESRVVGRIVAGTAAGTPPAPATPLAGRQGRRSALLLAAAAVVAVVAIGLGGFAIGRSGSHHPGRTTAVERAALRSGRSTFGDVVVSPGRDGFVSMSVDVGSRTGALADATVWCEVSDGPHRSATIGTFTLADGRGYWAAPVPAHWTHVTGAELVAANGKVIATASLG